MVSVRGVASRITDWSPFLLTSWDIFCLLSPMLPSPSSLPPPSSMLYLFPRANGCFSDSDVWKQIKTPTKKLFLEGHVPGFYMFPLSSWNPWELRKQEVQTVRAINSSLLAGGFVYGTAAQTSSLGFTVLSLTPLAFCLLLQILCLELFLVLCLIPGLDALGCLVWGLWVPFGHSLNLALTIFLLGGWTERFSVPAFHSLLRMAGFN